MEKRFRVIARVASAIVMLIGLTVVTGWIFGFPEFSPLIGTRPMVFNTAVAFSFIGLVLVLLTLERPAPGLPYLLTLATVISLTLGLLVTAQYLFQIDVGIDLLLHNHSNWPLPDLPPGRLAPTTALCFMLFGVALLLWKTERAPRTGHLMAAAVGSVGLLAVIGYAYGIESFYRVGRSTPMALHSAISFVLLSVAYVFTRPSSLMAIMTSETYSGAMARRLLPVAIIGPPLLGWLRLIGERQGMFPSQVGVALFVVTMMSLFIAAIIVSTRRLHSFETGRQQAEQALQESQERFHYAARATNDAIWEWDPSTGSLWWNEGVQTLFGYKPEEVGHHFDWCEAHLHPDDRERVAGALRRVIDSNESFWRAEYRFRRADGRYANVFDRAYVIRDSGGRALKLIGAMQDLTERQRVLEALRESEERFRVLFDQSPLGMFLIEPGTLKIGDCNEEAGAALGYTREEICRMRVPDLDVQFREEQIKEMNRQVIQEGRTLTIDTQHRAKNGETRDVLITAAPIVVKGRVLNFAAALDITDRKRAEQALRESEERFRAVADNMVQLAWMTQPDGSIFWYNKRWFDYTGTSLPEVEGWGWQKVHHPDHLKRVVEKFKETIARGESWEDTFPLRGRDGQYRWFLSRAVPIKDANGNVVRWFGTNTDITDLREAQAALEHAQEELRKHAEELEHTVADRTAKLTETVHELEAFSYSLSHDLRAPLRAMKGFSELLQMDFGEKLGEEGNSYLDRIATAAGRLDQLIEEVLTYSKVVREQITLKPIDIEQLIRQLLEENPSLQPPRAHIEIESPLLCVRGHEAYLMQAFSNLLYNAVKFVPKNTVPEVHIWTERRNSRVRICVRDNGIGIAPEHQTRIFGMFQRLHTNEEYEGTGIGLAIVRKAVERMRGRIGVESELGHGSTFWIELKEAQNEQTQPGKHSDRLQHLHTH